MHPRSFLGITALALLVGCTTWHHTQLSDKAQADRQFVQDDAYCTAASHGTVPIPQVAYNDVSPRSSSVITQGSTYNSTTGAATYGTYRSQVVTTPSPGAAFAGGFANGMNIGAAIGAANAQAKVYKGCMYAKGWSDSAQPVPGSPSTTSSTPPRPVATSADKAASHQIYVTPEAEWLADVEEFLTVYPPYKAQPLHGRLDDAVKRIAEDRPMDSGPQILLAAHDSLVAKAQGSPEPQQETNAAYLALFYRDAVSNSVAAQNAMGVAYAKGMNPLPTDLKRAAYWLQKAALAGDPMAREFLAKVEAGTEGGQ